MVKVNLIAVGKIKEKYFKNGIEEYQKRLSRFCDFKIIEINEENFTSTPSSGEIATIIEREGDETIKKIKGNAIAMCIEGRKISSEDFAKLIKKCINNGKELTFIVGGSHGLSEKIKTAATHKISFSDMTFPHTLFRLILTEQIYRAFSIISGSIYHK